MKFLTLTILLSSLSFASEKESITPCEGYRNRAARIQKELSKISLELAEAHSGPEAYSSPETHANNCEGEGSSNHSALISRRDILNAELASVRKEEKRACPRVYPE